MRKPFRLSLALVPLVLLSIVLVTAQTAEILTNESVVKMVKAGLGENLIIEMIRSVPNKFDLATDPVIQLKQAGVPQNVLSAMLASRNNHPSAAPAAAMSAAIETTSGTANSEWIAHPAADKLSAEPRVEATATFPVEGGAHVRATAACGLDQTTAGMNAIPGALTNMTQGIVNSLDDHPPQVTAFDNNMDLDTRLLSVTLEYLPRKDSGLALRATPVPQTVTPDAFGNRATISAPQSCVFMKIAVDQAQYSTGSSSCGVPNVASFGFPNYTAQEMTRALSNTGASNDRVNKTMGDILEKVVGAMVPSFPLMKQVFRARALNFLLPLINGETVLVRIEPQRESFQQFVTRCLAVFPDPAPKAVPSRAAASNARPALLPLESPSLKAPTFDGTPDKFIAQLRDAIAKAPPQAHVGNHDFRKGLDVISQNLKCALQDVRNAIRNHCHFGRLLADSFIDTSDGSRTEANLRYTVVPTSGYQDLRLTVVVDGTVEDTDGKRRFIYPVLSGTIK